MDDVKSALEDAKLCSLETLNGERLYCFSEVKAKLFSQIPNGTLKSWIRHCKIVKSKCTMQEHNYFKSKIPNVAIGAFKLISESDISRLLHYYESKADNNVSPKKKILKLESNESTSSISLPLTIDNYDYQSRPSSTNVFKTNIGPQSNANMKTFSNCTTQLDPNTSTQLTGGYTPKTPFYNFTSAFTTGQGSSLSNVQNSQILDTAKASDALPLIPAVSTPENVSNQSSGSSSLVTSTNRFQKSQFSAFDEISSSKSKAAPASDVLQIRLDSSDSSESEKSDLEVSTRNIRFTRKFPYSELNDETKSHIECFKSFYSRPYNTQRTGHALLPISIDKMLERILVFFKYVSDTHGNSRVSLYSVEDRDLVERFCEHLRSNDRKLKSSTTSRYMSSFINVVRFLHREKTPSSQENLPSLSALRSLQGQLEFDARRENRASSHTRSNTVFYEEILQVGRELLHDFEDCGNSISKARHLMNFCILLLYTHITGRCKEFVTVRIASSHPPGSDGNFLVCDADRLVLICCNYKTKRHYGKESSILEGHLEYYLRLFIGTYREKLLQGLTHDFLLVNHSGQPFNVPSFNKYTGTLFENYCNVRLSVNDLRHSLVTYFLSLPESNESQLTESMAAVMKHTVRTQRRHYDDRSSNVKKAPALAFLARKATDVIFDGEEYKDQCSKKAEADDDGFSDPLPCIGDFVALVASNSTTSSPQILLAKILRYSSNKKDVLLGHLEEVTDNLYKFVAGKSYYESSSSLIFPIDIVYKQIDRLYELRSDKLDLHKDVKSL